MYRKRYLEDKINRLKDHFKIILVTGARQVGKSTLLSNLFPQHKHLIFDPVQDTYGAKSSPNNFFKNFPGPLILDEIQYVPELLSVLKREVDQSNIKGQYLMTGSQNFSVMKNVSESLAGRVAILNIAGITPFEAQGALFNENWFVRYIRNPDSIAFHCKQSLSYKESLFVTLWRGSFPGIIDAPLEVVQSFFSSYVQTYVERDVRTLENLKDYTLFNRFLGLCAALTAQEINYSQLGREIGIVPATANRWLDILSYTYLWIEIMPYSGNTTKRLSKKPKGYIADTGLACYLQRITTPDALAGHPLLGALFESFCISMIVSLSNSLSIVPKMYHWRSAGGAEVDLILEMDGVLYPIEIKIASILSLHDTRGIKAFRDTYPQSKIAPAIILYTGTECYRIDDDIIAVPWNALCPE